jgi:hypothetical protein
VKAKALIAGLVVLLLGAGVIALASGSGDKTVSAREAERALRKTLPYRFEFRAVKLPVGATDAFAGRARGRGGVTVSFGVAFGDEAGAVPVPEAGTLNEVGDGAFIFTDDTLVRVDGKLTVNKRLRTKAQFNEASRISVDIEERICRLITGEPCEI